MLLTALLTLLSLTVASALVLFRDRWSRLENHDPRKTLAGEVMASLRARFRAAPPFRRAARGPA